MSLPPYKHIRNPAIEREDEFNACKSWKAPLITYDGIVEKRKTTDLKLIRSQSPHPGVEFEYLSPFAENSFESSIKNPTPENNTKIGSLTSGDEREESKSTRKNNLMKNPVVSESTKEGVKNEAQEEDARSTCSMRSIKSSASSDTSVSRKSAKSATTKTYRTKSIKEILEEPSDVSDLPNSSRRFLTRSRNLANGLDADDQLPYGRFAVRSS